MIGKIVEDPESSYTAGGTVKGVTALENSLTVPQKVKHRVAVCDGYFYK